MKSNIKRSQTFNIPLHSSSSVDTVDQSSSIQDPLQSHYQQWTEYTSPTYMVNNISSVANIPSVFPTGEYIGESIKGDASIQSWPVESLYRPSSVTPMSGNMPAGMGFLNTALPVNGNSGPRGSSTSINSPSINLGYDLSTVTQSSVTPTMTYLSNLQLADNNCVQFNNNVNNMSNNNNSNSSNNNVSRASTPVFNPQLFTPTQQVQNKFDLSPGMTSMSSSSNHSNGNSNNNRALQMPGMHVQLSQNSNSSFTPQLKQYNRHTENNNSNQSNYMKQMRSMHSSPTASATNKHDYVHHNGIPVSNNNHHHQGIIPNSPSGLCLEPFKCSDVLSLYHVFDDDFDDIVPDCDSLHVKIDRKRDKKKKRGKKGERDAVEERAAVVNEELPVDELIQSCGEMQVNRASMTAAMLRQHLLVAQKALDAVHKRDIETFSVNNKDRTVLPFERLYSEVLPSFISADAVLLSAFAVHSAVSEGFRGSYVTDLFCGSGCGKRGCLTHNHNYKATLDSSVFSVQVFITYQELSLHVYLVPLNHKDLLTTGNGLSSLTVTLKEITPQIAPDAHPSYSRYSCQMESSEPQRDATRVPDVSFAAPISRQTLIAHGDDRYLHVYILPTTLRTFLHMSSRAILQSTGEASLLPTVSLQLSFGPCLQYTHVSPYGGLYLCNGLTVSTVKPSTENNNAYEPFKSSTVVQKFESKVRSTSNRFPSYFHNGVIEHIVISLQAIQDSSGGLAIFHQVYHPNHSNLKHQQILPFQCYDGAIGKQMLGFDLDMTDNQGRTQLMFCCSKGYLSVAQVLLKYGADTLALDKYRQSALHYALKSKNSELIDFMLAFPHDLNQASTTLFTPLVLATINTYLTHVIKLVDRGANVHSDLRGKTVTLFAVIGKHALIAAHLIRSHATVDCVQSYVGESVGASPKSVLQWAIDKNMVDVVSLLLKYKAPVYYVSETNEVQDMVCYAIKHNNSEIVRLLCGLDSVNVLRVDPVTGFNYIIFSILHNKADLVAYFVELGLDIRASTNMLDKDTGAPLNGFDIAAMKCNSAVISTLIKYAQTPEELSLCYAALSNSGPITEP